MVFEQELSSAFTLVKIFYFYFFAASKIPAIRAWCDQAFKVFQSSHFLIVLIFVEQRDLLMSIRPAICRRYWEHLIVLS